MTRPTQDEWAFKQVEDYAERGTCIRRKAGALGLDHYGRIVGIGYNGVPRGFTHCIDVACPGATDTSGDTSRCEAVHAEVNMILNSHAPYQIEEVYVTTSPCFSCALILANLPNLRVVHTKEIYADARGIGILLGANIEVDIPAGEANLS